MMKNEVLEAIGNRRSTRHFKTEQISEEELQALLDAAVEAPSANNSQSWHFTVIQDKNLIDFISEQAKSEMLRSNDEYVKRVGASSTSILYNAPTVIVVSGKREVASSLVDCSAAIENMLIAAESIGLGAVWIGMVRFFFTLEDNTKKLNLPEGYVPYYAIAIGYKENSGVRPVSRNRDVVNYIR